MAVKSSNRKRPSARCTARSAISTPTGHPARLPNYEALDRWIEGAGWKGLPDRRWSTPLPDNLAITRVFVSSAEVGSIVVCGRQLSDAARAATSAPGSKAVRAPSGNARDQIVFRGTVLLVLLSF